MYDAIFDDSAVVKIGIRDNERLSIASKALMRLNRVQRLAAALNCSDCEYPRTGITDPLGIK